MVKKQQTEITKAYTPITIPELFRQTALRHSRRVALRQKKFGLWRNITWREYHERVRWVAQALLELGMQPGDKVAIIGENSPEWVIIDLGILMAGGVTVGIYTTNSWEQIEYIVTHAGCRFLFAENEEQIDKWLHFHEKTPVLERVIYWDDKGLDESLHPSLLRFASFLAGGREADTRDPARLDAVTAAINVDDLAILVYTSGTTGPPKGAMLSHGNLTWAGYTFTRVDPEAAPRAEDEIMSFLPLCHIYERLLSTFVPIGVGAAVNFVESVDTVPQNLREISPTVGHGVPRIWEKFHSTIVLRMADATLFKRLAFSWALGIGKAHAAYSLNHQRPPIWLRLGYGLAKLAVFYPLKKRLGLERMRVAFSAAAPISPEVIRFFHAIDLNLVEGYGLTESTALVSAGRGIDYRLGTVGRAVPGAEIRLSEDGEILVRSPGVFMGYYKNEEATAAAMRDGWLHTGDIGDIDAEGYLRIIDRKKDLIITAGGKNIAPQYIENQLKFSPYINDAIVIGDRRKYLTAIIVLDEENVNKYAQDHKIPYAAYADLATHADIRRLIDAEVLKVNRRLSQVEQVRKFCILNKKLYEEDGEVTPTMKVKRKFINEAYQVLIEEMYG
jgi:long-chain acyl-CoA synthetase